MKISIQSGASLLFVFLLAISFSACRKEGSGTKSPTSKVTLSFENVVDNAAVKIGPMSYLNAAGNAYSVDLLKYYVSNFTFVRVDDSLVSFQKYLLVDASDSATWHITLDSIPNGIFKAIRFYIGVDSAHNHTLAQDGALDPSKGMIWDWNTGYIFYKHEGFYKDASGTSRPLTLHLGTDNALTTVEIPLHGIQLDGGNANMHLLFNLNDAYRNPTKMDFNTDGFHMSTDVNDVFWINDLSGNLSKSFSLDRID